VGDLARELGVAKPVISRALDTLAGLGLLSRRRDVEDRRKVFVDRTTAGQSFVDAHARLMERAGGALFASRPHANEQEQERDADRADV
jgi:DNA-binding MarR family transcriptional regulator